MVKFGTHTHTHTHTHTNTLVHSEYQGLSTCHLQFASKPCIQMFYHLDFPTNLKMELKEYFRFTNGGKSEN